MRVTTVLIGFLCLVSTSQARVELTPFTGYQFGGEVEDFTTGATLELKETSNFGFILGFGEEGSGTQTEVYFSRQETEIEGRRQECGSDDSPLPSRDRQGATGGTVRRSRAVETTEHPRPRYASLRKTVPPEPLFVARG